MSRMLLGGLILVFVLLPLSAFAIGFATPFGGRIIGPPIPCTNPPGSFMITLSTPSPGFYKYVPGISRIFSFGPPLIPGTFVLGTATPDVCIIGAVPKPALRIIMSGTSGL